MKKTIIIFICILVGIFVLISFLNIGSEYSAEKEMWKINKLAEEIGNDPEAAPDATYQKVRNRYEHFIKKYPESKLVPMAHVLIGRLYSSQKKYPQAIEKFKYVADKYSQNPSVAVTAIVDMGKAYELMHDIPKVIATHKLLMNKYPLTAIGLKVPVIIGKIYQDQANVPAANQAFKDAVVHYQKIIDENPHTYAEFEAMRYLAVCYLDLGKREDALNLLGDLLMKSARTKYLNQKSALIILKTMNSIALLNAKSLDTDINLYKKFVETYPDHGLTPVINKILDKLEEVRTTKNLEAILPEK